MPRTTIAPGDPALERRLAGAVEGEVRFDRFTRGLYSTDASHYQIEPLGVVFPRSVADVQAIMEIAREAGAPVLPRGGGTSQCGQTVGRAIVVDVSRHLTGIAGVTTTGQTGGSSGRSEHDVGGSIRRDEGDVGGPEGRSEIEVQPGVVLDHLNAALKPSDRWFPVDPSTSSRATLGGMAGNNSAGARSLRYGMMVDNVSAVEVVLPDGRRLWLGEGTDPELAMPAETAALRALYAREAAEIRRRAPRTMRNVAGYNLDRLAPDGENLAQLLVGSEGTLAFFTRLRLRLAARPRSKVVGVCHFPGLVEALESVQHLIELGPSAVELVDRNVLELAQGHPDFRTATAQFVRGDPGALLLVEFAAEESGADLGGHLDRLDELLGTLGYPGSLVRAESAGLQQAVWSVRKAGLNIVMSMAGPRKPISFIEDCAVPLEHLGAYATAVDEIFSRHGASGTWYAHASVGCLHVRPALDLRKVGDIRRMRAIAEETHEVVRRFGGTHSGEHGDGLLRSEFLETMLGSRMVRAFGEVKRTFDPTGLMNPGKIVDPPRMDDRSIFRFSPDYRGRDLPVVLDWSAHGGLLPSLERCNNNGACRKSDPGVMCPSFRATGDERHSTRGRANALRLAVTGQLGKGALDSPEMADAMALCIGCKGCKRECPTGVDMARLKLEWQHGRNRRLGIPLRERALAGLPRMAPLVSRVPRVANRIAGLVPFKRMAGLAPERPLPNWSTKPWSEDEIDRASAARTAASHAPGVVLFVDTFTRWFEPENARAATQVLASGPWPLRAIGGGIRPLCCGRTYLSAGMVDEARTEARRLVDALARAAHDGEWIVGLEPSCLLTLRDEIPDLLPGEDSAVVASHALLLEEFLVAAQARRERPDYRHQEQTSVAVHGHCHQKALGAAASVRGALEDVPGLEVQDIKSGCCGMAGAFGYHAEHHAVSMEMGELDLLPTVRATEFSTRIVADGTSCRAQIRDGTGRDAVHAAIVLRDALVVRR